MTLPQPVKRYTPREYYSLERKATYKSDYYDGEIFSMEGTSRHSLISANMIGHLRHRLKRQAWAVYESNQRLLVKATGFRCYPDVSVYGEDMEFDPDDPSSETATNPTVLVEVLSKSTEGYDRGFKAINFRQIDSLRAYIFVSQTTPHVEVHQRQDNGDWVLHETKGLDAEVVIPAVSVILPMTEIYDRVQFGETEALAPG